MQQKTFLPRNNIHPLPSFRIGGISSALEPAGKMGFSAQSAITKSEQQIVLTTHYSLLITILLFAFTATAQMNFDFQEGTFMIKGNVSDLQTKAGIPKANIVFKNRKAGATADIEGNFTMYVYTTDTLKFTAINYISKEVAVAEIQRDSVYNIRIALMKDFIKLKDVVIYPFGDVDGFKQAFMEAKEVNKFVLPGIEPPKYSTNVPRPKFTNPVSFIYERAKKKRAANPDFKP